jgi:hypothetical protein
MQNRGTGTPGRNIYRKSRRTGTPGQPKYGVPKMFSASGEGFSIAQPNVQASLEVGNPRASPDDPLGQGCLLVRRTHRPSD